MRLWLNSFPRWLANCLSLHVESFLLFLVIWAPALWLLKPINGGTVSGHFCSDPLPDTLIMDSDACPFLPYALALLFWLWLQCILGIVSFTHQSNPFLLLSLFFQHFKILILPVGTNTIKIFQRFLWESHETCKLPWEKVGIFTTSSFPSKTTG